MGEDKKSGVYEWVINHGLGAVYTVVYSLVISLYSSALMLILYLISWWERIR